MGHHRKVKENKNVYFLCSIRHNINAEFVKTTKLISKTANY
jgi:hypothetical protein